MEPSALRTILLAVCLTIGILVMLYIIVLALLTFVSSLQAHVVYLHKVTLTWFMDLNVPEKFGFAHHQVIPFYIPTPDGVKLHTWHILPLGLYQQHQTELLSQTLQASPVEPFEETLNFRLLSENPEARLVLYFHGTSGTLASGFRPASYRGLYALDPQNTHILTFDYRGYGESSGSPSEEGLITDAQTIVDWALNTANFKPEQIVIFGQSLGSAVALALVHELAKQDPPIDFAGIVITSSFSDVAQLTATYRIGGVIPVLSPVAKLAPLFEFFTARLASRWDNMQRIGEFVKVAERYDITLVHAEDDGDIPMEHSVRLFRRAVSEAKGKMDMGDDEALLRSIEERRVSLGEGGFTMLWETDRGSIRLEIPKYGVHDRLMSYPVTSLAVSRAFESRRKV